MSTLHKMKYFFAIFFAIASTVLGATWTTDTSTKETPGGSVYVNRIRGIRYNITCPPEYTYMYVFDLEGRFGPFTVYPGSPQSHTISALTLGLQPWSGTESANIHLIARPNGTYDPATQVDVGAETFNMSLFDPGPQSDSWASVNYTDKYIGGGAPPAKHAEGEVLGRSNDGRAHTMQVLKNGVVQQTWTVAAGPVGGAVQEAGGSYSIEAVEGDVITYKVDGVDSPGQTVHFTELGTVAAMDPMYATWAGEKPPDVSGETPGAGNTTGPMNPAGTPPASPGSPNPNPPRTIVNNAGVTMGDATNQDIYNDVLRANIDAGNSSRASSFSGRPEMGDQPDGVGGSQADEIGDKLTEITSKQGEAKDGVLEEVNKFGSGGSKALTLPSSIGTKTSWSVTLPVLGDFSVNISPYLTTINLLRSLQLFVLSILAFFASVKIIRSAVA